MSKDLNQCNFIGRIGKPIDLKYLQSGSAVVNFSIACGDDYKDKNTGAKVEQTNWINIVMFGRLAETVNQYCEKGSKIFVSGKQRTRKWTDSNGVDRYSTEVVCHELQMLDSNPSGGDQSSRNQNDNHQPDNSQYGSAPGPVNNDFDDDIPFNRIRNEYLY